MSAQYFCGSAPSTENSFLSVIPVFSLMALPTSLCISSQFGSKGPPVANLTVMGVRSALGSALAVDASLVVGFVCGESVQPVVANKALTTSTLDILATFPFTFFASLYFHIMIYKQV